MRRLLLWRGLDAWRAEAATAGFNDDSFSAGGTQLGLEPVPYRLDYELEVDGDWITRRLRVRAAGADWERVLDLRHDHDGGWQAETAEDGAVNLPPPGGDVAALGDALDCDLALSPLTNVMPIRRHDLQLRPGGIDFTMAWVSAPDLALHRSRQRYEHVGRRDDGFVVRYLSDDRSFVADLELDEDGLVRRYPALAERVS